MENDSENEWFDRIVYAKSLGISKKEFWEMTPFDLYIERKSTEAKFARENSVNIAMLNAFMSYAGSKTNIDIKDFLGIKKAKIKNLFIDFGGNTDKFDEYLQSEEYKKEKELIDNY